MNNKMQEFLKIVEKLNQKDIVPVLMGSLGLEFVTQKDWQARDIDIHVSGDPRGWEAPDSERIYQWADIYEIMTEFDYVLTDLHEHQFVKETSSVEYGVSDALYSFAKVTQAELVYQNVNDVEFYTPTKEAFLKIYVASSQDSYRADKNNKKDFEKIHYLSESLNAVEN